MARTYLFTSESVTEGHPDKICDQISDAVLDAILAKDPNGRVACETTASTGLVHIMGEITTSCYVDIPKIAREVIRDIGYDRAKYGFDCDTCGIISNIDEQSSDIALGVDKSAIPARRRLLLISSIGALLATAMRTACCFRYSRSSTTPGFMGTCLDNVTIACANNSSVSFFASTLGQYVFTISLIRVPFVPRSSSSIAGSTFRP